MITGRDNYPENFRYRQARIFKKGGLGNKVTEICNVIESRNEPINETLMEQAIIAVKNI